MNPFLQRLADAAAALRSTFQRWFDRPALRRAGRRLAALVPDALAGRWHALRARHPGLTGGVALLVVAAVAVGALAMLWVGHDDVGRDYERVKSPGAVELPDFASIEATAERKRAFVEFLRPIVEYENRRVLEQRERLQDLLGRLESGDELAAHDRAWLTEQAQRYRVKADGDLERARRLQARIDLVPASLALAQGALESAWGTSRFARQGNNLFGEWCFETGCGIVPKRRPEHASYEVEAFDTVGASVRSYLNNLNSHPAYAPARRIRSAAREEGREPTGIEMAGGLFNYAAIGEQYVEHIRAVIRRNDLHKLALAD